MMTTTTMVTVATAVVFAILPTTCATDVSTAGAGAAHVPKKSNRYLAHIFNKYGSHGAIGFEVGVLCIAGEF